MWDGDQTLYELRTKGDAADSVLVETESDTGASRERTAYGHGRAIDQPPMVNRYGVSGKRASWVGIVLLPCSRKLRDRPRGDRGAYREPDGPVPGKHGGMPARDVARGDDAGGRGQGGQVKRAGADVDGEPAERADGSELMYQRNRNHDPASGRFTQQDPIGLAGGSNLYGFAGSDQLNYSDPFGLCKAGSKEKPCKSADAAAVKALRNINPKSIKENKEYAGEIVQSGPGRFFYTPPQPGDSASSSYNAGVAGYAGSYHTHGAYDKNFDSEHHSSCNAPQQCDKLNSDNEGKPSYIATPKKQIYKYSPDSTRQQSGPVKKIGQTP